MDIALQARLLRVLEDGLVRRVGDTRERRVDVRVICATNRDLTRLVEQGSFRSDLFYRIGSLPVSVAPLRERGRDVDLLFRHFFGLYCNQNGRPVPRIDDEVLDVLRAHRWPGNVRELRNLAERLAVFGTDPVTTSQLPSLIQNSGDAAAFELGAILAQPAGELPTLRALRTRCEREYIESVLQRTGWNITEAAKILDIRRPYLHDKMASLGIKRPED